MPLGPTGHLLHDDVLLYLEALEAHLIHRHKHREAAKWETNAASTGEQKEAQK